LLTIPLFWKPVQNIENIGMTRTPKTKHCLMKRISHEKHLSFTFTAIILSLRQGMDTKASAYFAQMFKHTKNVQV